MKFFTPQRSWLIYDPANSAYALIVRTIFAPLFFMASAKTIWSEAVCTEYWGYTASAAGIAAGILSLKFGNYADAKKLKKSCLGIAVFISIAATLSLLLLKNAHPVWILLLFFISMFCYMCANSFYDALLVDVSTPTERAKLSSTGYALGYIGGMIPLLLILPVTYFCKEWIFQTAFILSALWWGLGTIPLLKNVKEVQEQAERTSFFATLKYICKNKLLLFFLIAYFLYIDGIGTILLVATPLAESLHIPQTYLLITIFALQIIACPFTILYGKLADRFGLRKLIEIAIGVYILIALLSGVISIVQNIFLRQMIFVIIAFLIGTSQGGIQALSRALFSRIIPQERSAELFSVYNFFGKFTTIVGPILVGLAVKLWGRPELGITLLAIPFISGGIMLASLKLPDLKKS